MIDGANVPAPSIDFREPPLQQYPFAVVKDGAAYGESHCSALAAEGERSSYVFSVSEKTTKGERATSHTKRY
jgi:hypothetical protein